MIELPNIRLFPNYQLATNKAYETLIENKEFSFPIGIFQVLRKMSSVHLHSYSEVVQKMGITFSEYISIVSSNFGYSVRDFRRNRYEVFYNDTKEDEVQRFTLAHELGHIVLGHIKDGIVENREANCFARNYLCPIPAIIELGLKEPKEYSRNFYVSDVMADIAFKYKDVDYNNITATNYSHFNDGVICYYTGLTLNDLYGYYG